MSFKIAILGASGYTGAELARLISTHPSFEIAALSANSKAGQSMSSVFPHLRHLDLPTLKTVKELNFSGIDICFCALPHKASQQVISALPGNLKIVDLSADFRLNDPGAYEKWYENPHQAPDLQKEAVYGLTEFYRREIAEARLVAGTGCNAAAGQYALRPLVKDEVVELDDIILDLKCGVSGAGRSIKENLLHSEVSEGYNAYAAGGTHRHLGEFDQELSKVAGKEVKIQFTPHLVPANRGILATAYVKGNPREVHESLSRAYEKEVFLEVLPFGETPATRHVRGSNYCHIGVCGDRIPGRATIVAVLDNLAKGSSGQAVQNANVMLGVEETAGLMMAPVFP
ncbi:MAG: N-acetyl-gamma-glutamyl-phosphate reductase [Roseovarius sp.]|nr:N-acetyl-gamma-glutamyl-phosphate reductase [Roseovarius sp.]